MARGVFGAERVRLVGPPKARLGGQTAIQRISSAQTKGEAHRGNRNEINHGKEHGGPNGSQKSEKALPSPIRPGGRSVSTKQELDENQRSAEEK